MAVVGDHIPIGLPMHLHTQGAEDAKGEEKELLDTYYMLEYNSLIDHEHTNQKLFPSP
jgi:hypothetical protein